MSKLKVFTFSFPGVYLTGYAFVLAENKEQALDILRPLLIEESLITSDIRPIEEVPADKPTGRIIWNGDY